LFVALLMYIRVFVYWLGVQKKAPRGIVLGMIIMTGLIAFMSLLRVFQVWDGLTGGRFHGWINLIVAVLFLIVAAVQVGIIRGRFNGNRH